MPRLEVAADGFRLDDRPLRIISGGLHYFRIHPEQWADRLRKARLMGLNTIETYVPWNLHSPHPGEFRLDAGLDLPRFLDLAAAEDLHVLLRPGPYICAEWEGGGLPSWLLADEDIELRSRDPRYLKAVDDYLAALLPPVLPYLSTRGGPVLAVQLENEYGAYGDDSGYLEDLAELLHRHGVDVPLFTCDQPSDLERGGLDGVLRTVNLGSRVDAGLAELRTHQPSGPLMCSEFWIGWFDRWGGTHVTRSTADAAADLDRLLAAGASVNIYMFHGGTNFGFTNGANDKGTYRPTVTSYDYDAPLDEAGDPAPKYAAFREVIARHAPVPEEPVPAPAPKLAPAAVELTACAGLLDQRERLGSAVHADRPQVMEQLGQSFGFVLYETALPAAGPTVLRIAEVRDRAQVFVDGQPVGVLERENHEHALAFHTPGTVHNWPCWWRTRAGSTTGRACTTARDCSARSPSTHWRRRAGTAGRCLSAIWTGCPSPRSSPPRPRSAPRSTVGTWTSSSRPTAGSPWTAGPRATSGSTASHSAGTGPEDRRPLSTSPHRS